MSRTSPTPAEQIELQLPCNRCKAEPGEWCRVTGKQWLAPPLHHSGPLHVLRMYAALREGCLPIPSE